MSEYLVCLVVLKPVPSQTLFYFCTYKVTVKAIPVWGTSNIKAITNVIERQTVVS